MIEIILLPEEAAAIALRYAISIMRRQATLSYFSRQPPLDDIEGGW